MPVRRAPTSTCRPLGVISLVVLSGLAGIALCLLILVPTRNGIESSRMGDAYGSALPTPGPLAVSAPEIEPLPMLTASHPPAAGRPASRRSRPADREDLRAMLLHQAAQLRHAPVPFLGPCPCPGSVATPES